MATRVVDDAPVETVSFYYGLGSRYSYLASTQLESLAAETGCEIDRCPVSSVSLMRLRGVPSFVVVGELSWGNDRLVLLRHLLKRLQRNTEHAQLP